MQSWQDYQQKNKDRFLSELLELLRIPSVSARSEHKPDMQKCAEAVKQRLKDAGVDKAEIYPTDGHPVVYGEKIIDKNNPPSWYTATMTYSRPIRWTYGRAARSIPSSKTERSTPAAAPTIRDSSICT